MSRKPSDATLLRAAKAHNKDLNAALDVANRKEAEYRARATKAEQEVKEWKARFDALLKIVPASDDHDQHAEDESNYNRMIGESLRRT
jgi:hypothetical protein